MPDPPPARTIEGVDWAAADLAALVDRAARGHAVTRLSRDDREPADGIARAWQALDPDTRDALSGAIADRAASGESGALALALRFFQHCPMASGGDVFGRLALTDAVQRRPDPLGRGITLRRALIRAACAWRYGAEVPPDVAQSVRAEVLAGHGSDLVHDFAHLAPEATVERADDLLAMYPERASAVWRALVRHGADPEEALGRVRPHADERGRRALSAAIRFDRRIDADLRQRLLARLAG